MIINEGPRERVLAYGADTLEDHELLAVLLRTGYAGKNVLLWSRELLHKFGGLAGLANLSAEDLCHKKGRVMGFGPAKAAEVLAMLELSKRLALSQKKRSSVRTPTEAAEILLPILKGEKQEKFILLSLDVKSRLIHIDTVFIGTLDHALVHPREVFALALRRGAARIIVAHNHPSGEPTPSGDDEKVTLRLEQAGNMLGVYLVDHLIIGDGTAVSLKNLGVF